MISELFAVWCDLLTRISASRSTPLRGQTETSVWRQCLGQKKGDLRTFSASGKVCKRVIINERATNLCILHVLIMSLNKVVVTHIICQGVFYPYRNISQIFVNISESSAV